MSTIFNTIMTTAKNAWDALVRFMIPNSGVYWGIVITTGIISLVILVRAILSW